MHISQILAIASSLSLVAALPSPPVKLGADDVILYGEGRYQLMKRSDLDEIMAARANGTVPPIPGYLNTELFHGPGNGTTNGTANATAPATTDSLNKRGKKSSTLIVKNPVSRFLGWDEQMSAIVKGAGGAGTTITVTSGFQVSNSISVGASETFTLVKDFLEASVRVDYTTSWTSSQTQGFTATVPAGKYGAYVSNAWTNRQSGIVFRGVIGQDSSPSYYQGDSFENKQYGSMAWVDGVISLCTGDAFPLKRCLGDGTL
ncbi:hypothetical protein K504DRAFT_528891 [Pleomassaria siparia CBS 279.74]|uniref:Celp0028 effector like protein n=1 Tax=Pleomassaria siparia CBS 279.74 TaxID=1314801 RepID=A0A6G1KQ34_9PLEO|nr:hypothetical protein K504DRAFT_528891 [Pleomassaria siparia CBS 279.74]